MGQWLSYFRTMTHRTENIFAQKLSIHTHIRLRSFTKQLLPLPHMMYSEIFQLLLFFFRFTETP